MPDQELQKVKNRVAADSYRQLRSNNFLKIQLGLFEALGDWRYINEGPRRMAEVSADDIMRVVREYLVPTNRSVALYTRREGSEESGDELASFTDEQRQQIEMMLKQFGSATESTQLEPALVQIEGSLGMMPAEARPMMEYVVSKLKERMEELRAQEDEG